MSISCKLACEPYFAKLYMPVGCVLETASRATGRNARGSKDSKDLAELVQDLGSLLGLVRDGSKSPAVQCAALEAQLWFQVHPQPVLCSFTQPKPWLADRVDIWLLLMADCRIRATKDAPMS